MARTFDRGCLDFCCTYSCKRISFFAGSFRLPKRIGKIQDPSEWNDGSPLIGTASFFFFPIVKRKIVKAGPGPRGKRSASDVKPFGRQFIVRCGGRGGMPQESGARRAISLAGFFAAADLVFRFEA